MLDSQAVLGVQIPYHRSRQLSLTRDFCKARRNRINDANATTNKLSDFTQVLIILIIASKYLKCMQYICFATEKS